MEMNDEGRMSFNDKLDDLAEVMRLGSIAVGFINQPETLRVFLAWAKKEHDKTKPEGCTDAECMFNGGPEEWHHALSHAAETMAHFTMLALADRN